MTQEEIAAKLGITRQRVQQLIIQFGPKKKRQRHHKSAATKARIVGYQRAMRPMILAGEESGDIAKKLNVGRSTILLHVPPDLRDRLFQNGRESQHRRLIEAANRPEIRARRSAALRAAWKRRRAHQGGT
jgi:transcriptional regulator with XRE-family HTH domain